MPPDAGTGFQLFDLAAGQTPDGGVHPLAALLADTGVMATAGLWQQAAVFSSGTEEDLDDWLAPVAVAAGVLGRPLSPGEADAVAGWLPAAAGWMPAQVTDVGLGVALAQPADTLADGRLMGLLDLARRLPAPARADHLERLLTGRAVAHLRAGEPAAPVPLGSPAAEIAGDQAIGLLGTATPATAMAVLEWAAASGVMLPEEELERYGRARLDPALPDPAAPRLLRCYPAVLRGLLERLAAEPPQVTGVLLRGSLGGLLHRDDLAGHPELTELWLIQSVARGDREPLRAFDEIVDVRDGAQRSPRVDVSLLRLLWPGGCPADDITGAAGRAHRSRSRCARCPGLAGRGDRSRPGPRDHDGRLAAACPGAHRAPDPGDAAGGGCPPGAERDPHPAAARSCAAGRPAGQRGGLPAPVRRVRSG